MQALAMHLFGGRIRTIVTFDTLQQRPEGEAERLKAGGPSREAEIGEAEVGP